MSLEDLEIKKHTAPILAELDRQKEKAAAFKAERDSLRAQLAARDRDYSGSATVAAMDSLRAQRDELIEALENLLNHGLTWGRDAARAALLRAKEQR